MAAGYAKVVLPIPVFDPYTYLVPESLADRVVPGCRVVVPVRSAELIAVVTATDAEAPSVPAKSILAVPDMQPAIAPPLLQLGEWMARYYGTPPGIAFRAMLPGGMWGRSSVRMRVTSPMTVGGLAGDLLQWLEARGGEGTVGKAARALGRSIWDAADRLARIGAVALEVQPPSTGPALSTQRLVVLNGHPLTLLERDEAFGRRPRQLALYRVLEQHGGTVPWRHLVGQLGFSDNLIRALIASGHARADQVEEMRDPFTEEPVSPPPGPLTPEQLHAVESIGRLEPGAGALLFGITGSGKTLVYLEAIRQALEHGRGAILLVPEIALTPQTVGRVRGMFGDAVAVLHSGLSVGERNDAWWALRRGERRVAVGARSAVFAPVEGLGLIVVDEEHEGSYKNGESPRYHAREVAAVRVKHEAARCILGSATPSLESVSRIGPRMVRLDLPRRIMERPLPPVRVVDLRSAQMIKSTGSVPWSEALNEALEETLLRGEQTLLLLNRRGYSSYLQCRSCGAVPHCPDCSISLTLHRAPTELRCHYCDHRSRVPEACDSCGHPVQAARGVGTQQVETLLGERFPTARVARMDLDTTSAKWSHHRILGAMERKEIDILIGTQMIAKGLDLPEVTLVGVIDADLALHLPDFRSAERTFHLLTQVAGRAGRGSQPGTVIIQTRCPDHHALVWAAKHDANGFLDEEGRLRETPPYPPHLSLVNLVVSGAVEVDVGRRAAALADWCNGLATMHGLAVQVLGPAPCPVTRIKNRWRWHVLLKALPEALGPIVRAVAPRLGPDGGVRIVMDRDPLSLL
jgi:primosomal protein N' (replication factor Y)